MSFCAGSAGDAQPPDENPRRLTGDAGSAASKSKKKGRTKATGKKTAALVAKLGKLPVTFEQTGFSTYKPIGNYSNDYTSTVGLWVRNITSPSFPGWEKVPFDQRELVRSRLLEWFDIDLSDELVNSAVYHDMAGRYSDWKTRLADVYKEYKGEGIDDLDEIIKLPPMNLVERTEQWEAFVRFYSTKKAQDRAYKNTNNRKKQKYVTTQGRKSLAAHRYVGENEPSKSIIEVWDATHMKNGVFVNDEAASGSQAIREVMQQLSQQSQSSEAGDNATSLMSLTPVQIVECMQRVFGHSRDHIVGIGRVLPQSASSKSTSSRPSTSADPSSSRIISEEDIHRVMREMEERLRQQIAAQFANSFRQMSDHLRQSYPDAPPMDENFYQNLMVTPPPPPAAPSRESDEDNAEDIIDLH